MSRPTLASASPLNTSHRPSSDGATMAFPPQYRDAPPPLPSIIVPGSGSNRFTDHALPFARSPAMAIPGIESRDDVPPPLPPPRILPFGDAPTPYLDDMKKDRRGGSRGSSFASGYGSMSSSYLDDRSSFKKKDTPSVNGDEGYASYASTERSRDSLPAEFGLHHNKFQFQSAADLHGDSMKKKLGPIRTTDRSPPCSLLTSSVSDLGRRPRTESRFTPSLNIPIQLPIHSRVPFDSQPRESPTFSAASPRATPFHNSHTPVDHRSPNDGLDMDRSPRGRSRRNNSDDASSTQGSFVEDMEIDETSSLKRLHIEEAYAAAGQKRRAASPASDDLGLYGVACQTEVLRRRDGASRGSPTPRLSCVPQGPAVSALSSAPSRSTYFMSTISIPSSAATTASSFGHRSPGGISPGGLSPTSCTSPYNTPTSLNPSPRTSVSKRAPMHARTASGASTRKLPEMQKPSGTKFQFFMCECCPKKPKRFDTAEELSAHEAEKQYECSFCGNRFKNKNEAERHQNSLHVRRHSWSCSALSSYQRAFHESTTHPGEADTCGYCGDEFPRSGRGAMNGGISMRHATDKDWDERIRHLQEMHKFRECNSSKKFYRADHFRQHLKHSHAGTSGKWTNMLENACLMEEDPTPR